MPDFEQYLRGRTLILLSNREPYEHVAPNGESADAAPTVRRPPGGLVSALDPTMQRTQGTWVAWGSGSADRDSVDADDRVQVPPEAPRYTLRRVWLDGCDVEGYYHGFANSALWPLCHMLLQHYAFREEHWERYQTVNARFADAVAEECRRAPHPPVVWTQDYHFALVPAMLRERLAAAGTGRRAFLHHFWHIPFPAPDLFNLLPTEAQRGVLEGLLGNDLLEFHTERHAMNFMDCVATFVPDAQVRREHHFVRYEGRTIRVGAFPISVDAAEYERLAREGAPRAAELRAQYASAGRTLAVSVDRIDYTKGIPERLRALDTLWAGAPDLREKLTVLLVGTPSRSEIASYQAIEAEVEELVAGINRRWGTPDWTPIVYVHENVRAAELAAMYRAADLCLVSSLQDGMNLVAKEFVACNVDEHGVLVLSRLTGAAEEIYGAVLINPFNVDGFVQGLRDAIAMPIAERRRRMRGMRDQLRRATIFDWLEAILARVAELAPPADAVGSDASTAATRPGATRGPAVALDASAVGANTFGAGSTL
ncbi:MAG TPA: trehalose-6-phosphate synthase [Gemmatirosa sp.]